MRIWKYRIWKIDDILSWSESVYQLNKIFVLFNNNNNNNDNASDNDYDVNDDMIKIRLWKWR